MRTPVLALALLVGLLAIPALPAAPAGFDGTAQAMTLAQQPDPPAAPPTQIDADIDITDSDGVWYTNPVWLALGAIALIVLVLLIVSASRGGTTVVKD